MAEALLLWTAPAVRGLLWVVVVLLIVSGLDELFLDLVFWFRRLAGRIGGRGAARDVTLDALESEPEKAAALLVPVWQEADSIVRMLMNTAASIKYRNYHVFVGVYPDDEPTRLEVEKAREVYPNIDILMMPREGPANKADCLNWLYQGVRVFEKDFGVRFDFFVMHDGRDVVHPLSFKYYNLWIPGAHFVQTPLLPFAARPVHAATGTLMDEFAARHFRDLRLREVLARALPSAGVGTAVSREAAEYLARRHGNRLFDPRAEVRGYLMGLRLRDFEGRKAFLYQNVPTPAPRRTADGRRPSSEPVATRVPFPATLGAAVRRAADGLLTAAVRGWELGWGRTAGDAYFLFRDRKRLLTDLSGLLALPALAYGLAWLLFARGGAGRVPPLVDFDAPLGRLLVLALVLVLWRAAGRMLASSAAYGPLQGLLAGPRLLVDAAVNAGGACLALLRLCRLANTAPVDPSFPSEEELRRYHRRLGDLLLERRFVSVEQLQAALAEQQRSGRRLGDILLGMGALWEEDLVYALAAQQHADAVEVDPYMTPQHLLQRVPEALARQHRVFPLRTEGDRLVLATDSLSSEVRAADLAAAVGCPVDIQWCATCDLEFAFKRAYAVNRLPVGPPARRLGQRLVGSGKISEDTLTEALRRQKRSDRKLGEILVEMGVITVAEVNVALQPD
jgi:adsorption protein B